uniref:Variant surface glycoprotein 1125.51 n=1 Tax=Trypanosoma brucei TaxID=5691 RepID=M4TDQ9_9TRYP|nr:variant surface glycoprotein 649 [Trypanosoma brucei]APD72600.1 variant surface glycoprotein 1125.51 [Trypanosoma brucei]
MHIIPLQIKAIQFFTMNSKLKQTVLTLCVATATTAQGTGLKPCASACACKQRALSTAAELTTLLERGTAKLADNAHTNLLLTAAAAAQRAAGDYTLAPVAAIAAKTVKHQARLLAEATPTIVKAYTQLQLLAGHYSTLIQLTRKGDETKVAGTSGGSYAAATYAPTTLEPAKVEACAEEAAENASNAGKLLAADDLGFQDLSLHSTIAMACQLKSGGACTGMTGNDYVLAKVVLGQDPGKAGDGSLKNGAYANIATGKILATAVTNKQIKAIVQEVKPAVTKLQQISTVADSTLYTKDKTLVDFVTKQVLGVDQQKEAAQGQSAAVAAHITTTYGNSAADFQAKIWSKVEDTEVSFNAAKAIETKHLTKATPDQAVASSIAVSLAKQHKTEATDCPLAKPTDNKIDKCVGNKGTACTGDCEWDNDKEICKPKKQSEGENKEKTGTANATASNSFVIKASPLLLAFLLF